MKYFLLTQRTLIFSFFLSFYLLTTNFNGFSQCGNGGNLISNLSMLPTFQTTSVNAGNRYTFTAYSQTAYMFTFCQGGGSTGMDTQIEICNQAGTVVYASNDDFCGLGSELLWIAPANGTYSVVVYKHNCQGNGEPLGTMAYMTLTPPTEQDCLGAIPLCFATYHTTNSYSGEGHYLGEIPEHYPLYDNMCPGNCLLAGELNDVWYTFTVQTSGTVGFTITPNNLNDDYDWAVYNLTNANCVDIATQAGSLQASCNFCGESGATGPNGGSNASCQHGNSCSNYNAMLNVTQGQRYVVNISNFSSTQSGYTIGFNGTAQILDDITPYLQSIVYPPMCGLSHLTVQFSEQIWCLGTNPEDFIITGPNGQYVVDDVWAPVCLAGLGSSYGDTYYDDTWTLELADYLEHDGDYTISIAPGTIRDICGNFVDHTIELYFHIDGVDASASVIEGESCYGANDGHAVITNVIGGTAPYTYEWPSNETTLEATNLPGGNIFVTVTDSTGICKDIIELNIPQQDPIYVDAGNDTAICQGESVSLGGMPAVYGAEEPYTFQWSPAANLDDPNSLNPTTSPNETTTYTLLVEDATGCTGVDSITVSIFPNSSVSLGPDNLQVCTSSLPFTLDAGSGYTNYVWNNPAHNGQQSISVTTDGTYSVTVTSSNGCTATDQVNITIVDAPTVNLGSNQTVCSENLPFTLDAGAGYSIYEWNNPSYNGQQIISVSETGTYSVTVSDDYGCSGSGQITLTANPEINLSLDKTDPSCYNEATGSITATVSGGTPSYTYAWNNSQTSSTINNLQANQDYTVTVTDNAGCTISETISLVNPPQLIAEINTVSAECGQADGEASVTVTGGTGTYSYQWSNNATSSTITGVMPGNYTVTVTDENGCKVTISTTINAFGSGDVSITEIQSIDCYGNTTGVLQAEMLDGFPPYQYAWSTSNTNSNIINNLPAGTYSVTITDDTGCVGVATYNLTQPSEITISDTISHIMCKGETNGEINVQVFGGTPSYTYSWSNGETTNIITDLPAGSYSLIVTDSKNCTKQKIYTITESDKEVGLDLKVQDVLCYKTNTGIATATPIGGTPPYLILWYKNGGLIANGTEISSLTAGNYSVIIVDDNKCQNSRNFVITQPDELMVGYEVNSVSCKGNDDGEIILIVGGGTQPYEYQWSNGGIENYLEEIKSGTYTVTIIDDNDCQKTVNVYVPESNQLCIRIPNAFTPNDDGVNDTWIIEFINKYPNADVFVFNRWGQKLYDMHDNTGPWDGHFNGKKVPAGAYIYIIDLKNGMEPFTGTVTVVY
ncbi:MAG: T9SS type B sorting domain-containing protein [Bacteroidales bacterium]|nr:T9SS type B sorting domain-containing protein [Bacteroidales bacterium]